MNSRITDEKYTQYLLQKEYDKIIASSMNYMSELMFKEGKERIVLDNFDINSDDCMFLYKVAKLCNALKTYPIYLKTDLISFIKFKIKVKKEAIQPRLFIGKPGPFSSRPCYYHKLVEDYHKEFAYPEIFEDINKTFWTERKEEENNEEQVTIVD